MLQPNSLFSFHNLLTRKKSTLLWNRGTWNVIGVSIRFSCEVGLPRSLREKTQKPDEHIRAVANNRLNILYNELSELLAQHSGGIHRKKLEQLAVIDFLYDG